MISSNSVVVTASDQISSDLSGEAVILNLKSGVYYGLNSVGAWIWNLIRKPKTVSEIRATILAEYEVESEQCNRDLLVLLQQLKAEGLIEVSNETAA
ncbi:lasso peptide biosynthesis PqqD family chaperone [Aerosakkonemataceae cyanobacterium BLCC-F50]|uniref:Lasso peptide biosynthesis PqqD family chaperone n=1 Tax=Floridaenema flaviceps BLCC-F50 TaxID=3153642 RepID=A0ABV4XTS7_9CYAN